jgi:NAD(P)-dependent dehydrogenase (short-subunit alcohol dehydrogenase family)
MKDFRDRVAVVTGAGSGIGRALAVQLGAAGAKLALVDVDPEGLAGTAALVGACSSHVVDVSDAEAMLALAPAVVAEHGGVHLLINNAGLTVEGAFREQSLADWQRVIGVNLMGVVHGLQAFLPHLEVADEAWIVNLSSVFGIVGIPTQASYCASKYAVRGLSESLWEELRGTHIGLSVVHPGGVNTNIANRAKSYDPGASETSADFFAKNTLSPDRAAAAILRGVRAGKPRILVTREAPLIDAVKRLMPVWGNQVVTELTVRLLGLGAHRDRKRLDFEAERAARRASGA